MEIVQPTTSKVYSICYSKGVSQHHSCLAETQRQGDLLAFQWKKRKGFRYAITGGHYWHEEVVEGLTRSGASYAIGWGFYIWLFPVGPKVEAGAQIRKAVSCWSPVLIAAILTRGSEFYFYIQCHHCYLHIQSPKCKLMVMKNLINKLISCSKHFAPHFPSYKVNVTYIFKASHKRRHLLMKACLISKKTEL